MSKPFDVGKAPEHVQQAVALERRIRFEMLLPLLGWALVFAANWAFPESAGLGRWAVGLPGFAMIFYWVFMGARLKWWDAKATLKAYQVELSVLAPQVGSASDEPSHRQALAAQILDRLDDQEARATVTEVLQQCAELEHDLEVVIKASAGQASVAGRLAGPRARLVDALHRRDLLLADLYAAQLEAIVDADQDKLNVAVARLDTERELLGLKRQAQAKGPIKN